MAIKGKKKSQQRGSQARRRPAQAPRPVTGRTTRKPWYQTTAGQSIAGIAALIAIVLGLVLWNNARTASEERELRQESLENFTDQMKALVQTVTGPASELSESTLTTPDELSDDLKTDAEGWRDAFTAAQTQASQAPPADGTSTVQQLIGQSLSLYRGATELMIQATAAEGDTATELLALATSQVASAEAVWMSAVDVLDAVRDDADLNASALRSPSEAPAMGEQPAPSATLPVVPEDDATGGGGGGKGGKGGKNDKGDDS